MLDEDRLVDILGSDGHGPSDGSSESDNIDQNPSYVCSICTGVHAEYVEVRSTFACAVQIFDLEVAFPNGIVIRYEDTGNRAEEDSVAAKIGSEVVRTA